MCTYILCVYTYIIFHVWNTYLYMAYAYICVTCCAQLSIYMCLLAVLTRAFHVYTASKHIHMDNWAQQVTHIYAYAMYRYVYTRKGS